MGGWQLAQAAGMAEMKTNSERASTAIKALHQGAAKKVAATWARRRRDDGRVRCTRPVRAACVHSVIKWSDKQKPYLPG